MESTIQPTSIFSAGPIGTTTTASIDEVTPWWNASFHYRRHVNLTDTNSTPRVDVPMHVWVSFEDDTCFDDSIRVVDPTGIEVPSQVYNMTYGLDPNYIIGATVFWYANIDADSRATYWIYYSEDISLESTNYDAVVDFARTTGTLSGKFGVNYWSFKGDWYNVTMYNQAGGKISNGAHKLADGSWNWNWGTSRGSMHWNPDGLGGQGTSNTAPIASTTFVNVDGPLFINYTTQLPFGSGATLNVTYTFYKWGWTTRIYIEYTAARNAGGRTDEWVFYPYLTTGGIEVAEDGTQTYHSNWAQSGNKGKPAGFGWWNSNGFSHGTVRISHDSWNTNPSYTNNYDNYYYRWWDQSSYEFWDTVIPTIYAIPGTVLEERTAFAVWNGSEDQDGYMEVFNATSRYLPISRDVGDISSYSFKVNVQDLGGANIENVNVTLLDADTGEKLYKSNGEPYSALTDVDGNATFIGLVNKTYTVSAWIDSSEWLKPQNGATGMNVTWTGDRVASGPFTPVAITLDLASIDIHLEDLMLNDLATSGSETLSVRVYNGTDPDSSNWRYMDYTTTDTSGDLTFVRVPKCDWVFNFSYTDTDTGHIYQWSDFGLYVDYHIPASDIISDLSRPNWQLPLVTVDFSVTAYDAQVVPDAYIRLSKAGTGQPYPLGDSDSKYNVTHYTDSSGDVTFYRILNGTWTIDLYRTDDYGQIAFNNTENLWNLQGYNHTDMVIPLTWLRIVVIDAETNRVTGAQIDLKVNGADVVTAFTDSSGVHNFHWIKANDSSIPWNYEVTITKVSSFNTVAVYASNNYLYENWITLATPTYLLTHTELNCTTSVESWNFGDNRTFLVGWYNRSDIGIGVYEDVLLTNYPAGWVNFTIYHLGSPIGGGTWNGSGATYVAHDASDGIYFTIIIDTLYFGMDVSSYPYIIEITADAPGYDPTDTYTVTVVMSPADTLAVGETTDIQYWMDGFGENYALVASPYGRVQYNVSGLDFANYTIYDSEYQVVNDALLADLGGGTYRFADALLDAADVGTYEIVIWLYKQNYINRSVTFTATILPIPTSLSWAPQPGDYIWGSGTSGGTLLYLDTSDMPFVPLPGADSITLEWIDVATDEVILIDTSGSLLYSHDQMLVYNGTWKIRATVTTANYVTQVSESDVFTVFADPFLVDVSSPLVEEVAWGAEWAEFDFTYEPDPSGTAVSGASLIALSWTGEYSLIDNEDGTYRLRLLAVQESVNQSVSFTMWLANRTKATGLVTVNILIPLEINVPEGATEQSPISEYWTRQFLLSVAAADPSSGYTFVSGVTVTFDFPAGGVSGEMTENFTEEYYWTLFPASYAPEPGIYEIVVTASRVGCIATTSSIFIEVLPTPSRTNVENQFLTVYYADSLLLNFTWTTTIDTPTGITSPDGVTVELWATTYLVNGSVPGIVDFGDGNYTLFMDTKGLDMLATDPNFPTIYSFVISFNKIGYETPLAATIIILVLQTPTEMTADAVPPVLWSEEFTIRVYLEDIVHHELVGVDVLVEFVFGDFVEPFNMTATGIFEITLNSWDVFSSSDVPHSVTVRYTLPNYIDGSIEVDVKVDPLPAYILIETIEDTYDWGETFPVRFTVKVNATTDEITANVYYFWVSHSAVGGTFVYDPNWERYDGVINTGEVPAVNQTLRIVAERVNYSIAYINLLITIKPLQAVLTPEFDATIIAIHNVNDSIYLPFSYTYDGVHLSNATITYIWVGRQTLLELDERYVELSFDPADDESLVVPGTYYIEFNAVLTNYTAEEVTITLKMQVQTEIEFGPQERVEAESEFMLEFSYLDVTNGMVVDSAIVTIQYQINDGPLITVLATQMVGTQYVIRIPAAEIGGISQDAYTITIYASAPDHQNYTSSSESNMLSVYVDEPTIGILGFSIPRSAIFLMIMMTVIFGSMAALSAGYRRWKIPYPVKQIDKALDAIEKGDVAKVQNLRTMGAMILELLHPGLEELELTEDDLDMFREPVTEEVLTDDATELLDELDALDEIGADDTADDTEVVDYEAELEAELDTVVEEAAEETPEVEPEAEVEADAEVEAEEVEVVEPEVVELEEAEAEVEVEEDVVEPEPEIESEVESPEDDIGEEPEPEPEIEMDEAEEAPPEIEEEPETELDTEDDSEAEVDDEIEPEIEDIDELVETEPEEIDEVETEIDDEVTVDEDDPEVEITEELSEPEDVTIEEPLSKAELIEKLPSDVRESMSEEELKKLSKKELEALVDTAEDTSDEE